MGIYYEWSDYQKGLSYERLRDILSKDKGFSIIEEISGKKEWPKIMYFTTNFSEIKEWATENLSGIWTSVFQPGGDDGDLLAIFFNEAADAMAFKLRWL